MKGKQYYLIQGGTIHEPLIMEKIEQLLMLTAARIHCITVSEQGDGDAISPCNLRCYKTVVRTQPEVALIPFSRGRGRWRNVYQDFFSSTINL
jgi:hypothetical protein